MLVKLSLIVFLLFGIVKKTLEVCPADKPNSYGSDCFDHCPWQPPTNLTYLDGTTCLTDCGSKYADDYTRQCVTNCPTQPILTFKDNNRNHCVERCSTNPSQFADLNTNTCVQYCTSDTYGDPDTRKCVDTCPTDTFYQIQGSHQVCTSRCYPQFYADLNKDCVAAMSCPSTPVPYYGDDSTNMCVTQCPHDKGTFAQQSNRKCVYFCELGFYADETTRKCVDDCPVGPPRYYGSNITRKCHLMCIEGQYADDILGQCVRVCSQGTYGDNTTRKCVETCPEKQNTYADEHQNLCVKVCIHNQYADNDTRKCVVSTQCSRNLIADPVNRICVDPLDCPTNYFIDVVDNICVTRCSPPYWGNTDTRYCMLMCQWNPPAYTSFYDSSTRTCVEQCPNNPRTFSLNTSQKCQTTCPTGFYGSVLTYQCLKTCPDGFHSDQDSNLCLSDCTTSDDLILYFYTPNTTCISGCPEGFYADNTTMSCVEVCPEDTYGYETNNTCLSKCPNNFYSDDHSQMCVQQCPKITGFYADDSTNKCVKICPVDPDYYGQDLNDGHRKCVSDCTADNHYADPLTRTCVFKCNVQQGYFGYDSDQRCYQNCPNGWGNPLTAKCVGTCPQFPIQMFGDNLTATCVERCSNQTYGDKTTEICMQAQDCPTDHFGDDTTALCVSRCSKLEELFGDPVTKKCLPYCQDGYFADYTTRLCETSCNATAKLYKDFSTKTCVNLCPQMPDSYAQPANGECEQQCSTGYALAYNTSVTKTRKCVSMCPSSPVFFADEQNKKCVLKCANLTYQFVNNTYRGCLEYCPAQQYNSSHTVDLFRDNTTWKCVSVCPQEYYAFKHPSDVQQRDCVPICHMHGTDYYFAENNTRTCVTQCPFFLHKTYADRINFQCVYNCSRKQFRDNETKSCTFECSDGYFADNTTYMCVEDCPVGTFAETINKTCVLHCPKDYFGYVNERKCLPTCDHWKYFADNISWLCIKQCPSQPDYYQDPGSKKCVDRCPSGRYASPSGRKCTIALHCSDGLYADPITNRCVERCTTQPMYFLQPSTNLCGAVCQQDLFADNSTNQCVDMCPSPYYGVNTSSNYYCVQYCPNSQYKYISDDETVRMCLVGCPDGLFADDLTMTCVKTCPDFSYGNSSNNKCVLSCQPLYSDDDSKQCVSECPDQTTASNNSYHCQDQCDYGEFQFGKVCQSSCPDEFFADNLTRKCMEQCPDDPFTFADPENNLCVFQCPVDLYALVQNRTCVQECPEGLFMQLDLRQCVYPCPNGTLADPDTLSCVSDCLSADYTFMQPYNQSCVEQCPQQPDLYGLNDLQCVQRCPQGMFAQNFTRKCVDICPNVSAIYLNQSFADNLTHRCVQRCSALGYAYTNQTHNICLNECPQGFFASQLEQACVQECPDGFFAHNDSNTCLAKCPNGQWGDVNVKTCMDTCDLYENWYKDNSTNLCVEQCPQYPSLFAQQSTMQCVLACQSGTYAYVENRTCETDCPQPLFADDSTGSCIEYCPIHQQTFGDQELRQCVSQCDNHTIVDQGEVIFYADKSISMCVRVCSQQPQKLYGFNETNECLEQCPEGTYGDNDTRLCLDKCVFQDPKYEWMDQLDNFCVTLCPQQYFADNVTGFCQSQCSDALFADNSTRRCVATCPVTPAYYGDANDKVCVQICPLNYFADEISRNCLQECPTNPNVYFHYTPTRKCVLECLYPYFAEQQSQYCVQNCQDGYYGNLTTHKCQLCRPQCVTCTAFLECTSCVEGYYKHEFDCVLRCPSYPIVYFAHQMNGACFKTCPEPYFGQTNTGKCQYSCPVRYYGNMDTRVCTQCPVGCLTCDVDGCYSCLTNYTHVASSLTCSYQCNSTHPYFFKDKCYLFCPNGSYLDISDLVTCLACNDQCGTCSNTASNCTTCAYKFYYQGQCIDACPKNFFVDDSMICQSCSIFPDKCTLQPLRYTIHPFQKNYKQHAYVVFNRAVDITLQQFEQIVQIKYNGKRVNPSKFSTQFYNQTTYWVTFTSLTSLNQNALSIGFQPGSIVDFSGNHLTVNQVQAQYEEQIVINEEIAQTSETIQQGANLASWILLALILLFLIKSGYPFLIAIQCVQFYFMFIFLKLEPMPYMQLKFLDSMKNVNLMFLPSLFPDISSQSQNYFIPVYQPFMTNTSFINNCSPMIVIFGIAILLYIIFYALSRKGCFASKNVRHVCKKIVKYRMRYMIFNDAVWFTFLFAFFMASLQLTQISFQSTWDAVNVVLAIIALLIYLSYTCIITYFGYKFKDKQPPRKWGFLKMEPAAFPMEIPFRYIRKILFCLALLLPSIDSQCICIIVVSSIFLMYLGCYLPSESMLTNTVNIIIQISYIVIAGLFYSFGKLQVKDLDSQVGFSYTLIAVHGFVVALILFWIIFRGLLLIKQSQTWQKIYKRITENKDPQYLRQQQRKRDLQFDLGSLQNRTFYGDNQTEKDMSSRNIKMGKLNDQKFNIFEAKDEENDGIYDQDSNFNMRNNMASSSLSSRFQNEKEPFKPTKTQQFNQNRNRRNVLQIQQKDDMDEIEKIQMELSSRKQKNSSKNILDVQKEQSDQQKQQQQQPPPVKQPPKKDVRAVWDDIEFDQNEI